MHASLIPLLLGALFTTGPASAPASEARPNGELLTRNVSVGKNSYAYQVFVPGKLRGQKNAPVLVFLHGIGQRGAGGFLPAEGPAAALARQYLEEVPAVVLLPQCDRKYFWNDGEMERMTLAALDETVREFGADARRLYLAGVSMGGYGAWHFASQRPGKFAAVVAVCGGSPVRAGERFAAVARAVGRTPVWVFHGAADRVVPVSESRRMVEALRAVEGNRLRYSEYAGVGHNVWLNALAEPALLPWLFAQRLG
ncbi:MAG: dienelactone hydrolase family protein [Acidobacteria bacterium]|nr:dienelactone hydrolase family protein [Acidobacteriota bacterium]